MGEYYIGLDIGGTKCAAVLGKVDGNISIEDKIYFLTEKQTPDAILSRFDEFIEKKKQKSEPKRQTDSAVSIGPQQAASKCYMRNVCILFVYLLFKIDWAVILQNYFVIVAAFSYVKRGKDGVYISFYRKKDVVIV